MWQPEQSETIEEDSPGSGKRSSTVTANPGEKVHFDLERIDGATYGDCWRVAVDVSTDPDSRWSNPSVRNRRLLSSETNPNLVVSGYYAYSVWIENDDPTPQDQVEVTVRYRKDGVNI